MSPRRRIDARLMDEIELLASVTGTGRPRKSIAR